MSKYHLKIIILIITSISVSAIFYSCSNQKTFGSIKYEGYIYDSIGGSPAQGQRIILKACVANDAHNQCDTFTIGETTSDSNGYFKITGRPARSGRYYIIYISMFSEIKEGDLTNTKYTTLYVKSH